MIKWIPSLAIAFLSWLALLGDRLRAYELGPQTRCNYALAELALPTADVVLIGASRVLRGLDPDLIENSLIQFGAPVSVDRLSLNLPNFSQFYPLLRRYLDRRGAPQIAYLQLAYNFKPKRQDTWDLPLNPKRNLAFGRFSDLVEVQLNAPLNDTGTRLPRQLHANWQSLPAALMTQVEMDVFSALRYLPKRMRGQMPECSGDFLRANGTAGAANGLTVDVASAVGFVPPDPETLVSWKTDAAEFLPLDPGAAWRRGETAQLRRLVALLQGAGTEVVFLIMPSVGQTSLEPESLSELDSVFPGVEVYFPMSAYSEALAEQVSVSFVDTHHANDFGAVHFSLALSDDLRQRLVAP